MKCPYCGSENLKTLETRDSPDNTVRRRRECEKRPVTMEQIHELADHVRQDLMTLGKEEVTSQEVGDLVMKYSKELGRISYVRFASVYRSFEEPQDFERVLKEEKT